MNGSARRDESDSGGVTVFERELLLEAPPETVYAWHARPGAFGRLSPPWERVELVRHTGEVEDGARVRLRLSVAGMPVYWDLEHTDHQAGRQFCDRQVRGPFRSWHHLHRFEPVGPDRTLLRDRLTIGLPFGALGRLLGGGFLRRQLERLFQYRHEVTASDLRLMVQRDKEQKPPMNILVTGASGLIGETLVPFLTTQGHRVVTLGRNPDPGDSNAFQWDPDKGELDDRAFEGVEAVIHLAGANLAAGRWSSARKKAILESRVKGTRLLVERIARAGGQVRSLVSSSAIGYYGDTGETPADESSPNGRGFLAEVCRCWEEEAMKIRGSGVRLVLMRTGVVLTPKGGALGAILPVFRKGAGGPVGGGRQWMSWISVDDLAAAFLHALETESLSGPCNGVAPEPVRNADLAEILGRLLHRPAVVPVPSMALRLLFGQMADETLLASCRVLPGALEKAGFTFRHPNLDAALRHVLGLAEGSPS
ncbi:MAG: TIGR01777 family oxidoreductase [Opitutaceae bacterium]